MKFLIHAACKLVNFLFYSNLSQTCCGFFRAIETIISKAADVMELQGVQRDTACICVCDVLCTALLCCDRIHCTIHHTESRVCNF